jgi:hypothetical protein
LHQPFFSARCELNQHAVLLLWIKPRKI